MKKILLILILLTAIIFFPKVNAEMIPIYEEQITNIDEDLEGRIYRYGTPIKTNQEGYIIEYYDLEDNYLGRFEKDYDDPEGKKNIYVGYKTTNNDEDLKDVSDYWIVTKSGFDYYEDIIRLELVQYKANNHSFCNLKAIAIGDYCYHDSEIIIPDYTTIYYWDGDNKIGERFIHIYDTNRVFGYLDGDESVESTSTTWKLKSMKFEASVMHYQFEKSKAITENEVEFNLTCDKEKINYKDKTICHLKAKNYQITTSPITLTLNEKDDLELIEVNSNNNFYIDKKNNKITIKPKYISTNEEDIELFTFEVKAKKEKNEIDNIEIKDITYYDGETYTNLKTTINIENKSFLTNNPLTANPTLFRIILVSALLLISTSVLLKRQRT